MAGQRDLVEAARQIGRRSAALLDKSLGLTAQAYRQAFEATADQLAKLYRQTGGDPVEVRKYRRLESLLADLASRYRAMTGQVIARSDTLLSRQYELGVRGGQWAVETGAGIRKGWGVIPASAVRASVLADESGAVFSSRLRDHATVTIRRTAREITRGLLTGETYQALADRVKADYAGGLADAVRVIRTESARCYNEGHQVAYEQAVRAGIGLVKEWRAARDKDTRPDHASMDGVRADEDGIFTLPDGTRMVAPLVPAPGEVAPAAQVVNCRCSVLDILTDPPGSFAPGAFDDWLKERNY